MGENVQIISKMAAAASHEFPAKETPTPEAFLRESSSYVCTLSSDLLLKAQKELHEKPEWRQRDIEGLRDMVLQQQQNGLVACLSDNFLLRFLRSRKFDYDRSLQVLINYYSVRYNYLEIFADLSLSSEDKALIDDLLVFLPDVDYYGRRVLCIDLANWKADMCSVDKLIQLLFLALELELCNEASQVSGISVVVDLRGLSLSLVLQQLKPSLVKKISHCLQGSFPMRLKSIHLVHESTVLDVLITMIKPFMTEKLRQRLYFHGSNLASLQQHIDRDVLKESLGGNWFEPQFCDASSKTATDCATMADKILAAKPYYDELLKFGFTESPPVVEECETGSPFRSVLTTYKRICIDGLNA